MAEKAAAVESYFQGEEPAARAVCENAAQAKVVQTQEGGSDYTHPKYASLVQGASATLACRRLVFMEAAHVSVLRRLP